MSGNFTPRWPFGTAVPDARGLSPSSLSPPTKINGKKPTAMGPKFSERMKAVMEAPGQAKISTTISVLALVVAFIALGIAIGSVRRAN